MAVLNYLSMLECIQANLNAFFTRLCGHLCQVPCTCTNDCSAKIYFHKRYQAIFPSSLGLVTCIWYRSKTRWMHCDGAEIISWFLYYNIDAFIDIANGVQAMYQSLTVHCLQKKNWNRKLIKNKHTRFIIIIIIIIIKVCSEHISTLLGARGAD